MKTKITIASPGMGGQTEASNFCVTKCMSMKSLDQAPPDNKRVHTDKTAPEK
jgi:hypothetical protein